MPLIQKFEKEISEIIWKIELSPQGVFKIEEVIVGAQLSFPTGLRTLILLELTTDNNSGNTGQILKSTH